MTEHCVTFSFPKVGPSLTLGRGIVEVHNDSLIEWFHCARTGSVNRLGQLVNPIPDDREWAIRDRPVMIDPHLEPALAINGVGWKVRLWNCMGNSEKWEFSHYLFHPDGNLPGSAGCIVFPEICLDFPKLIHLILDKQPIIPVYVNRGVPIENNT
jgi:hypothetical protein